MNGITMIRVKPILPVEKQQEMLMTNDGWLVSQYCCNPLGVVREINRVVTKEE